MRERAAHAECPRCGMEVEAEVLDGHLIWLTPADPGYQDGPTLRLCEEPETKQ